jgi:hypothetical protein
LFLQALLLDWLESSFISFELMGVKEVQRGRGSPPRSSIAKPAVIISVGQEKCETVVDLGQA